MIIGIKMYDCCYALRKKKIFTQKVKNKQIVLIIFSNSLNNFTLKIIESLF